MYIIKVILIARTLAFTKATSWWRKVWKGVTESDYPMNLMEKEERAEVNVSTSLNIVTYI